MARFVVHSPRLVVMECQKLRRKRFISIYSILDKNLMQHIFCRANASMSVCCLCVDINHFFAEQAQMPENEG